MSLPEEVDFATLFASGAHEIKNQLFLLLNAVDQARQEPWVREHPSAGLALERLEQGGAQIGRRLTQLLALYRIAQGHYPLDIRYHDALDLLEEVALEIRPLLRPGEVELEIGPAGDGGVYGFFDLELVRGILLNAVHNALKAGAARIRLGARQEAGLLCFRVEDDGPGFPARLLEAPAVPIRPDLHGGKTGLGLHFCATAAALHRNQGNSGFIRLENGGDLKGAVFSLYLP